jgi:hypothetical protein
LHEPHKLILNNSKLSALTCLSREAVAAGERNGRLNKCVTDAADPSITSGGAVVVCKRASTSPLGQERQKNQNHAMFKINQDIN